MAYSISDSDTLDEQQKRDGENKGETQNLAPQTGDVSSNNTPGGKPGPSSSGSYTNLQSYIDANKDQSPSGALANKLSQRGDEVRQSLTNATSDFSRDVKAGAEDWNPELVDNAIDNASETVKDKDKVSAFQRQLNDTYKGPHSLSDEASYNPSLATELNSDLGLTDSESGQVALLNKYMGRPNYTQGEKSLDQLILKNTPSADNWTHLKQNYGNIGDQYSQADKDAQAQANARIADAQKASSYAKQKDQGAINSLNQSVTDATGYLRGQRDTAATSIKQALANRDLSGLNQTFWGQQLLQQLQPITQSPLYHTDFSNYINPLNDSLLNNNTVATPEEQARMAALTQLGGVENTYLPFADQAGKANQSPLVSLDMPGIQGAIQQGQQDYRSVIQSPANWIHTPNSTIDVDPNQQYVRDLAENTNGLPLDEAVKDAYSKYINALPYDKGMEGQANRPSAPYQAHYQELQNLLNQINAQKGANDTFKLS